MTFFTSTPEEFIIWLHSPKVPNIALYFQGNLIYDRATSKGKNSNLDVADLAYGAYIDNKVELVQYHCRRGVFNYLAIKKQCVSN